MRDRLTSALRILRQVADRPDPLEPVSVGGLSKAVALSTSSTSRIAAELELLGLLERAELYGTYRVGRRALALSGLVAAPYSQAVSFALTLAAQSTRETVCVVAETPQGPRVVSVVQSPWTLHVATKVADTIEDPDSAARSALRAPRRGGTAAQAWESASGGTREVATPILDIDGAVVAALLIRYPQSHSARVTPLARQVLLTARQHIESSTSHGHKGPSPAIQALTAEASPEQAHSGSAVSDAVEILEHIASSGAQSVRTVSKSLGLRVERVWRLLQGCADADYVSLGTNHDTVRVHWGLHGWHRAIIEARLRGRGQGLVEAASLGAGMTIYLTVRQGVRSCTVAEAIARGALSTGSWLGRRAQLVGSDGGPLLVMDLDDEQIRRVLPQRINVTARRTPRDLESFLSEVRQARRTGTLVMEEFGENGLTSVAAPVRDASGAVAAAACLVGPKEQIEAGITRFAPSSPNLPTRFLARSAHRHRHSTGESRMSHASAHHRQRNRHRAQLFTSSC